MNIEQISLSILELILILASAKIFGEIAERLGQPPVLGELIAGVVLAVTVFHWMKADVADNQSLWLLAELGVVLLLFEIGLESDLEEFLRVGASALLVALIGVAGPFLAGYAVSAYVFKLPSIVSIFIGATLTATSVGITARTLADLGQLRTSAAKIILGAAVIDDVLGLIILAVVRGLAVTGEVSAWQIGKITILALGFLLGAILIGVPIAPYMLRLTKTLRTRGILTISAFVFCLTLAYLAEHLGLAAIVGAFAAGLVLARTDDLAHIQERMKPIADILIPVFFVMLGVSVNIDILNPFDPSAQTTLTMMGALVVVAVAMKLLSGFGVLRRGVNRLVVGIGMIPRGEVGLIFAAIGFTGTVKVINAQEYAAVLGIVLITTFITPLLLRAALRRAPQR